MSSEKGKDNLKRGIEALDQDIQSLNEENKNLKSPKECYESEAKRFRSKSPEEPFLDIDCFVQNLGFQHIAVNIFKHLDHRSLGNCRRVSKGWKTLIDQEKDWWQAVLKCLKFWGPLYIRNFGKALTCIIEEGSAKDIKVLGRFLLNYYCCTNQTIPDSPLHYAVDQNRVDIFKILAGLPYFKDFNIKNLSFPTRKQWHNTLLGNACVENRVEIVDFFMNLQGDRKIDFRSVAYNGCTLFQEACKSGSDKVVQLFLDRAEELNIDLNSGGFIGPFILAANSKPVLDLLLKDQRINVEATDGYERTALLRIFSETEENMEIIDTLLQSSRINLTAKDFFGQTVLHLVCKLKHLPRRAERLQAYLEAAMRRSIGVNIQDNYRQTFLHCAFDFWGRYPNPKIVRDEALTFPFTLYKFSPVAEVILKYIKKLDIDLEARDKQGKTPLHVLYQTRSKENVEKFLLAAKKEYNIEFDLKAKDNDGLTPPEMRQQMSAFGFR